MKGIYTYYLILFVLCGWNFDANAQGNYKTEIEHAIQNSRIERAENILNQAIAFYTKEKNTDSLVEYIFYTGKITRLKSGVSQANKKVRELLSIIEKLKPASGTLRDAYIEAGGYYGSVGDYNTAYQFDGKAYQCALNITPVDNASLARIQNSMGGYAQRIGNFKLVEQHTRLALKYLLSTVNPDYESVYLCYASMGNMFLNASKNDSSLLYFHRALNAISQLSPTPRNKFYRPALIYNSLASVYQTDGRTTLAIESMDKTILNLKDFINSKEPDVKKESAVAFQFEAIDNLAGIYKDLGNLRKAKELYEYSYQQKQKNLTEDDPGIFISQILLGQLYSSMKEFELAVEYLKRGLANISKQEDPQILWQADACNSLSVIYDSKNDVRLAEYYYGKADSLYEIVLQGSYDNVYLDFLRNASLFYAENNRPDLAISKSMKGYNYIINSNGPSSLGASYQLLNLAEIYSLEGQNRKALEFSKRSLEIVDNKVARAANMLDSIRIQQKKPRAILWESKAQYALLGNKKDEKNLKKIRQNVGEALSIIEQQKTILNNSEDEKFLLSQNADIIEFAKKLDLEIYRLTNNDRYLTDLIGLHESGLYNKIRSRLVNSDSLRFLNIPQSVIDEERGLEEELTAVLQTSGTHNARMQSYLDVSRKREFFIHNLKEEYPKYYNLKYSSIFKPIDGFEKSIPRGTTVIRYFFIQKKPYALVADNNQKAIYELNISGFENIIIHFAGMNSTEKDYSKNLYNLYRQLWEPLEKSIRNKRIIVIPDGIFYNLNFEVLTPQPINNLRELATKSLLAQYTFSYQYSLFFLKYQQKTQAKIKNDFVAFAPGFSDQLKQKYLDDLKDKSASDKEYLSLLPQPFASKLVQQLRKIFGGKTFTGESASKSAFISSSANHKIIHIGTHAESDNLYPNYSRLIFAKADSLQDDDSNYLYVNEIYGCDLNSDLSVLTACETGKPGYEDGEGMISLAHAFYYAGSKSILTGLWNIDEQASAIILTSFYKQLKKGLPKDEALRQAKLEYLMNAEGRTLSPEYWAGLVIMGEMSPVKITPHHHLIIWVAFAFVILLTIIATLIWRQRRNIEKQITGYRDRSRIESSSG